MNVTPPAFRTDRAVVLDWAERGAIPNARLVEALTVAGITPSAPQWRFFLDQFLLWCGAAFLGAGAIFFIASNWTGLARYQKFRLVEAAIVISVLAAWALGIDRVAGKAALLVASLATGGLLAFFGQTYQTGADTWELFASWGALLVNEARLQYRVREGQLKFATNAFFFEEGRANLYEGARYGEFRVDAEGYLADSMSSTSSFPSWRTTFLLTVPSRYAYWMLWHPHA